MRRLLVCLLVSALPACGGSPCAPPGPSPEDLLSLENRGLSHLERYTEADTLAAVDLLGRVVENAPDWRDARVNYALALAASRRTDLLAEATRQYDTVLREDPGHPHALLGAALVRRFQGQIEEGLPYLRRLLEIDPEEASVYYWLGAFELERTEEDLPAAEAYLRRALALAPDDTTAMTGLYGVLSRLGHGDTEEASLLLRRAHDLEEAKGFGSPALVKHRRRGDKEYGEAGKYGRAILDLAPPAGAGLGFARGTAFLDAPDGGTPALACGDADGDGDDDLWIAGPTTPGRLHRNDGGRFADATAGSGLEGAPAARAALFADLDDDGRLDLVVAGDGIRAWRGLGEGRFAEVPADRLRTADRGPFTALCATDLDHDGDVDLLAAGPTARFLRNRRDGSFDDVAGERGLAAKGATTLCAADADGDGILDVVLFGDGPARVLRNGRVGNEGSSA